MDVFKFKINLLEGGNFYRGLRHVMCPNLRRPAYAYTQRHNADKANMLHVEKEGTKKVNEWGANMRAATDHIITHLTQFHRSTNQHDILALSRLTESIAQMLQLQESITLDLQTQLTQQARIGQRTERRISQLEIACLQNRSNRLAGCGCACGDARANGANDVIANNLPLLESQEGTVGGVSQTALHHKANQEGPEPSAEQKHKSCQNTENLHVDCAINAAAPSSPKPPVQTPPPDPPAQQASRKRPNPETEPNNTDLKNKAHEQQTDTIARTKQTNPHAPQLPTIEDVEKELLQVRKRRRQEQNRPDPPACAKCRVRKRADMMRQAGRINEDVFERWARRPGACLGFMHMDEPGEAPSPLSFAETETQAPKQNKTRKG